jgi:hypothetical protein
VGRVQSTGVRTCADRAGVCTTGLSAYARGGGGQQSGRVDSYRVHDPAGQLDQHTQLRPRPPAVRHCGAPAPARRPAEAGWTDTKGRLPIADRPARAGDFAQRSARVVSLHASICSGQFGLNVYGSGRPVSSGFRAALRRSVKRRRPASMHPESCVRRGQAESRPLSSVERSGISADWRGTSPCCPSRLPRSH